MSDLSSSLIVDVKGVGILKKFDFVSGINNSLSRDVPWMGMILSISYDNNTPKFQIWRYLLIANCVNNIPPFECASELQFLQNQD